MYQGFGSSPIEIMASEAMLRGEVYLAGFTYSATWLTGTGTALGANATVDSPLNINADSDFVVQELNLVSFTAADTPETNPDYLLTIVVAGSGRQLMNQGQHVMNYTGAFAATNGVQVPMRLPMPILLSANTGVTNTLQNRSAVGANRVDLMFRGFKVFYLGPGGFNNRQKIFHAL